MSKHQFFVYVAAPYDLAELVREIHQTLNERGISPTSSWAVKASGAEKLDELSDADRLAIAHQNDADVLRADIVLALTYPGKGGEMFCEARFALDTNHHVVWVGPRFVLSAYRERSIRVANLEEAFSFLDAFRKLVGGKPGPRKP